VTSKKVDAQPVGAQERLERRHRAALPVRAGDVEDRDGEVRIPDLGQQRAHALQPVLAPAARAREQEVERIAVDGGGAGRHRDGDREAGQEAAATAAGLPVM
jgi:hypothetical protein